MASVASPPVSTPPLVRPGRCWRTLCSAARPQAAQCSAAAWELREHRGYVPDAVQVAKPAAASCCRRRCRRRLPPRPLVGQHSPPAAPCLPALSTFWCYHTAPSWICFHLPCCANSLPGAGQQAAGAGVCWRGRRGGRRRGAQRRVAAQVPAEAAGGAAGGCHACRGGWGAAGGKSARAAGSRRCLRGWLTCHILPCLPAPLAAHQWTATTLGSSLITVTATDAESGELAGVANVSPGLTGRSGLHGTASGPEPWTSVAVWPAHPSCRRRQLRSAAADEGVLSY